MRRTMLTGVVFTALALALPSAALAHHHGRHHARHHAHHATVRVFGAHSTTTTTAPTTGSPSAPAPTSPTTEPAGKVVSFNEGVLVIALTGGGEVSGKVTEATHLECEGTEGTEGDDDGPGSTSGDHGSTSGPRDDMSGGSGSGDDEGDGDHGDDDAPGAGSCTTAALVPGATVNEAELAIGPGGAVWEKVELG